MAIAALTLLGMERPGVTVTGVLPDDEWSDRWDGIIVAPDVKARLLSFGLFCVTQRATLSNVGLPVHGLALLSGPPGTGKTTLAHGLANELGRALRDRDLAEGVMFAVVDPHAFPSEFLGESQRAVSRLFRETLPEMVSHGLPTVVLLDEVETLAVTRARASFETNPVDVHRATDAVLTGLDYLSSAFPNVLLLATTNEEAAVDRAFLSRVDLHEYFALPDAAAVAEILAATFGHLGLQIAPTSRELGSVAASCAARGLDARQVRKLVLRALVSNGPELAIAPHTLSMEHVEHALDLRLGELADRPSREPVMQP